MSEFDQGMNNAPDITLGEALEEIRQLHLAGERLRRERDEARANAAENFQNYVDANEAMLDAKAQGFERGVKAAADVVEEHETNWKVGLSENKAEVRDAILALLEPTLQKPEA